MAKLLEVSIDGGKYKVIQESDGRLHALRYGEEWRDLVGDGLVCSMAYEIANLRELVSAALPDVDAGMMAHHSEKLAARMREALK